MSSKLDQSSLYGQARPKPSSSFQKDVSSSSTLAFTTHLASLISKEAESPSSCGARGRPRPSKTPKSDLFAARPNKGIQKRAAADLLEAKDGREYGSSVGQKHQRTDEIGGVDPAALRRSKKRMEEKVRIYEDLKKGMYLAESSDEDEEGKYQTGARAAPRAGEDYLARLRRKEREALVDFDRKWADAEERKRKSRRGRGSGSDEESVDDDENEGEQVQEKEEDDDDDDASVISYEDELGRSRRGTRAQAARAARLKELEEKRKQQQQQGVSDGEKWKPARPANLIYGATVQAEAFQPSAATASRMSYISSRRDRSPTPPDMTRYDAKAEVRNRGTGFYAFSKDEETRQRQMEELMSARQKTQREREERQARKLERQRVKEERRKKIEELRTTRRADVFLAGLGDLSAPPASLTIEP